MEDNEPVSNGTGWWPPDFYDKMESVALSVRDDVLTEKESISHNSSQELWSTGSFSGAIPNGFYSLIPEKKLKDIFPTIPSLDELQSLGMDGLKADIILVDTEKDKKLCMLKQLSAAFKGLSSNPALVIKKIASLVFDFYKRPNPEPNQPKAALEESSQFLEYKGVQLLGQIRHGSCRPRAILFKFLADAIGLESKIVVGIPNEGAVEFSDSYKHMSVVVVLNSMELLVDLMRFPGQLIPFSAKSIFASHISAAGESDSAENDSCDSPLEPNSPLCGVSDKLEADISEQDDNLHQRRMEASSNLSGRSLRNSMLRSRTFSEGRLSSSHSEPNIANVLWRHNQRTTLVEEVAACSSPEHHLLRAKGRSTLGSDCGVATPRSDGSGGPVKPSVRRIRRRSISITPEIGDDIVRAVRAMNETLKQNRLQRDHVVDGSYSNESSPHNATTQKTVSLPSSPHEIRGGQEASSAGDDDYITNQRMVTTWNKVLQGSPFTNKPLLLFEEWNIDFSELTTGTRVGIGFFGEVFRGIWNGTDVAIKVFLEQDLTTENMEDFCNEVFILSRLRHPNVILFLGACMKPPNLSMVTEYMEMGSLYYLIHMTGQKKRLTWRKRLKMLRDICRGLMCIHRMKIIHRDLKSANCLVNKHWVVKICDFGLSRIVTDDAPMTDSSSAGTPEWMAPELIRNEPFTEKCDIFSLGVIMWELCTLKRPWNGIPPVQVVYAVANEGTRLEIPEGPLGKLIADCWAEPHERPSCQEILSRLIDCEYTLP